MPRSRDNRDWIKKNKKKKKKRAAAAAAAAEAASIGAPYDVSHDLHVSEDLEWTRPDADDTPALGAFALEEVLGSGTFGTVHRARHRATGFVLAIKTVKHFDGEMLGDFDWTHEVAILRRLRSPLVVGYFGVISEDARAHILLEYIDGGSAAQAGLHKGSEKRLVAVLDDVCRGLAFLHGAGVVHRDIKPANILLTKDGAARLADFGVSAIVEGSLRSKLTDIVGTALYLSPEMLSTSARYDARADIWALGITTYELATGHVPHEEKRYIVAMTAIVNGDPPRLGDKASKKKSHSLALTEFVACCLRKDPNQRPLADQLVAHPVFGGEGLHKRKKRIGARPRSASISGPINVAARPERPGEERVPLLAEEGSGGCKCTIL